MWPAKDLWRAPLGDFPPPWASAWGDDVYGLWADLTVNGVTQRMRWIEPTGPEGFWMGSTQKERDEINDKGVRWWANERESESRQESVKVGFWLADTPCTQAFWEAVTGRNPSYYFRRPDALECPVESVSWNDVMYEFIERLVAMPDFSLGDRLCLPDEIQWEYAARAGTRTAYWWGDVPHRKRLNCNGEYGGTTPVRSFAPNPWGLYDMHGNVWEWCANVWQMTLDKPDTFPEKSARSSRGGSWLRKPYFARAAFRDKWLNVYSDRNQGFRFALKSPGRPGR